MAGDEIQALRDVFETGDFRSGEGQHIDAGDFLTDYVADVLEKSGQPARSVKVAIDCANAVPGPFMVDLCNKLGCDTVAMHCEW
ncbi:MAG: hypothetical protein MKZ56_07945, partial [Candidatus Thalassarchaeum sp.]|nr:hypothetical protein [Candidatus Thalassarchaeum sp.]